MRRDRLCPPDTRRPVVQLVQWFGMAIAIIAINFFVDTVTREVLAGGYLVMIQTGFNPTTSHHT
jgi:hypothetical protein